MTRVDEMRRVIAHVSEKLAAAVQHERDRSYPSAQQVEAPAYAKGVLDLLHTYLIDDEPQMVLHLLDDHGVLWNPDGDRWQCPSAADDGDPAITREDLTASWGPLREVWLR